MASSTPTSGPLRSSLSRGVLTLTLDRPARRNAIDPELRDALRAALDGVVTGAGLALALACDWRVGTRGARVLFREGQVGLVPTHGGVTRMVKLLGLARAKELLLGGDELDGLAAHGVGLISELALDGADVTEVAALRVEKMLGRAPLSFAAAKRLLALAADVDLRSGLLAESLAQTHLLQTADHHEGLAAVRERREPTFRGA
jgi:enoyl-CoA hydratase/carnithine racemase